MPDLAEHIALDVLHDFIKEVNAVYEPGATMWIINDGHVFSDCIGVDDEMIDTYDACMSAIYAQRFPKDVGPVPSIRFKVRLTQNFQRHNNLMPRPGIEEHLRRRQRWFPGLVKDALWLTQDAASCQDPAHWRGRAVQEAHAWYRRPRPCLHPPLD